MPLSRDWRRSRLWCRLLSHRRGRLVLAFKLTLIGNPGQICRLGRHAVAVLAPNITITDGAGDAGRNNTDRRGTAFGEFFVEYNFSRLACRSQGGNLAGLLSDRSTWTTDHDGRQTDGFALFNPFVEAAPFLGFCLFQRELNGRHFHPLADAPRRASA